MEMTEKENILISCIWKDEPILKNRQCRMVGGYSPKKILFIFGWNVSQKYFKIMINNFNDCWLKEEIFLYIIRIVSQNKIPLINKPTDLKTEKTKDFFDDGLFSKIYKILEWDECNCLIHFQKIIKCCKFCLFLRFFICI